MNILLVVFLLPPVLSYQVNCHYVTPLSTAKLVCALETDSDSNTDVSWTHNGVLVEPGSATSITHNHVHITGTRKTNLNIVSAGYSDAGIYLAHVKGVGVSIVACNITLEMRQKPSDCPCKFSMLHVLALATFLGSTGALLCRYL